RLRCAGCRTAATARRPARGPAWRPCRSTPPPNVPRQSFLSPAGFRPPLPARCGRSPGSRRPAARQPRQCCRSPRRSSRWRRQRIRCRRPFPVSPTACWRSAR
ncbi:unnamed protein product, partial [Ectocarpus fasciculatus]